ncbi:MAG: GGDEF domain-containing protein [Spirochaetales bacterium]|nr:GGDEF domain-containing protein [Spirochaetales bacterium]
MKKSRTTIGFFIESIREPYELILFSGINAAARKLGMNLLSFVGDHIEKSYKRLKNKVYYLASSRLVDAIIVSTGTITYQEGMDTARFFNHYSGIPLISISQAVDGVPSLILENKSGMRTLILHLLRDHGYRKIAFIRGPERNQDANERFQAYRDALEENNIPFDPGLVAPGDFRIETGRQAINYLLKGQNVKPDAIVAANDIMAEGAIEVLKERGYQVPGDIAVTGFDDLENSAFIYPALSTVRQPLFELGEKALDMALSLINGESVPNSVLLPTVFVIRESCGCIRSRPDSANLRTDYTRSVSKPELLESMNKIFFSRNMEPPLELLKRIVARFFEALEKDSPSLFLRIFFEDVFQFLISVSKEPVWMEVLSMLRIFASSEYKNQEALLIKACDLIDNGRLVVFEITYKANMLQFSITKNRLMLFRPAANEPVDAPDLDTLIRLMARDIPHTGMRGFYLVLCEDYALSEIDASSSRLLFAYDRERYPEAFTEQIQFPTADILPDSILANDRLYSLIIEPLFRGQKQYGIAVSEFYHEDDPYLLFVHKTLLIGSFRALLNIDELEKMNKALTDTLTTLQKTKKELVQKEEISLRDELTGLYNRRGLFILGERVFKETCRGNGCLRVFFIDMDGLKKINDTFGHDEGDRAIRYLAQILATVFKPGDIISRIGGDEFVIIMPECLEADAVLIENRIRKELASFPTNHRKPYALSACIGHVALDPETIEDLDKLVREADRKMYEEKITRKIP